jgi:hypothetical protein
LGKFGVIVPPNAGDPANKRSPPITTANARTVIASSKFFSSPTNLIAAGGNPYVRDGMPSA